MATSKWPTVAMDIPKCSENKGEHQFGVLSKTVDPSLKKPRTVVKNDGRWFKYHPPDDHHLGLALHPFPHRFWSEIIQNVEQIAKFGIPWFPPLWIVMNHLVTPRKHSSIEHDTFGCVSAPFWAHFIHFQPQALCNSLCMLPGLTWIKIDVNQCIRAPQAQETGVT